MTNIELIKAGKLAIRNDDTASLKKCCMFIWPDFIEPYGGGRFYIVSDIDKSRWDAFDEITLPTILSTELLKEIENAEWKPKRGELVEISDDGEIWHKRIFLAEIDGLHNPFFCVAHASEEYFKSGNEFGAETWKHIRPIPTKHKVTKSELLAEYARANGIEVSQIEITD